MSAPILAELFGSNVCTAAGLTSRGATPILNLCRRLVAAGHDPNSPVECYRGDVLALTVITIGQGAALELNGHGTAFVAFRGRRAASPVRSQAPAGPRLSPEPTPESSSSRVSSGRVGLLLVMNSGGSHRQRHLHPLSPSRRG